MEASEVASLCSAGMYNFLESLVFIFTANFFRISRHLRNSASGAVSRYWMHMAGSGMLLIAFLYVLAGPLEPLESSFELDRSNPESEIEMCSQSYEDLLLSYVVGPECGKSKWDADQVMAVVIGTESSSTKLASLIARATLVSNYGIEVPPNFGGEWNST